MSYECRRKKKYMHIQCILQQKYFIIMHVAVHAMLDTLNSELADAFCYFKQGN